MIPKRSTQEDLEEITLVKTRYDMSRNSIPEPPPMPPGPDDGAVPPTPPPLPPPPPECVAVGNNNGNGQDASRTNSFTENGQPVGENTPALSPTSNVVVKKRHSGSDEHGFVQYRKRSACNETMHVLSSLYAKLVLVATAVLVTTEVLNNPIPLLFYHGYLYMFLTGGGVICLMSIYICIMVDRCPKLTGDVHELERGGQYRRTIYHNPDISIFLRTGMLLFGLGTLITNGLEIATIFTLARPCTDEINMAQPILQCLFTFLQMHFLFLNSQEAVRSLGWFRHLSLMHLMSANLATWIKALVWETTTEYLDYIHVSHNFSLRWPPKNFNVTTHAVSEDGQHRTFVTANCLWKPVDDPMEDLFTLKHCLQNSTIGEIWDLAQPYLSPFTIQYNLIAAAIIYTFWYNADWDHKSKKYGSYMGETDSEKRDNPKKASARKLDCKGSSKGLFLGLLVLCAGLIILILFFVLNHDHDLHFDTLFALITMHGSVLGTSALAVLLGLCQIQRLRFRFRRSRKLSDLVQGSAVLSVFAYGTSSMIVGATDLYETNKMVLFIDGALMVFHASLQSLFIRQVIERNYVPGQEGRRTRPGRQVVMYLVFTNIVLWMVELFTAQGHVFSQMQLEFYGKLPWGIFTRIAIPLMVFYRFHSSVVLMEAWRKSYSAKSS